MTSEQCPGCDPDGPPWIHFLPEGVFFGAVTAIEGEPVLCTIGDKHALRAAAAWMDRHRDLMTGREQGGG